MQGIKRLLKNLFALPGYIGEFRQFKKHNRLDMPLLWRDRFVCLDEKTANIGFDAHYIYHTAWAARKIAKTIRPKLHVDISSALYFSTIVSAFVPVKFYDFRPANVDLSNLSTGAMDLSHLPFEDGSIQSLSCMHVVEHIGLGRYGDRLDPNGDITAMKELERVLKKTGHLLFVVPVGKPRIQFNAHRIYSYEMIINHLKPLKLKEFSLIDDNGKFTENAQPSEVAKQQYGCGCFLFQK